MVFRRKNRDGKSTEAPPGRGAGGLAPDNPSNNPPGNPLLRRFVEPEDAPTVLLDSPEPHTAPHREAQTRMLAEPVAGLMDNPPAGVLLVVEGPGKGACLVFGYGMNSIGRAPDQRVPLDFGDQRVSRERHAVITYDGNSRKFYLHPGIGPGLTYIGAEPVLAPVELSGQEHIRLGDTVLRFIPLCGPGFDWQD